MRSFKNICSLLTLLFFASVGAQDNNQIQNLIEKGKSDLVKVLEQTKGEYNFGLTVDEVNRSNTGSPIEYKEMNFNSLLNYKSGDITPLLGETQKWVVPFMINNKVITTISLGESKGKYSVIELINHRYHNELGQLPTNLRSSKMKGLTMVYVPNLNTIAYIMGTKVYTAYGGNSIRDGISVQSFLNILKKDAIEFQRKYGDELKKGRLLN